MSILFRIPLSPFLRRPASTSARRVLLVRDDVIGDLLVPTSAVVRWLCQQGYEVYLVLRKELLDIGQLLLPRHQLLPVDIKAYRSSLLYRYAFLQRIRAMGFDYAMGSTIHSSVNDDIVRSCGASCRWGYKRNNKLKECFRLRGISKVDSLPMMVEDKQEYTSVVEHERHFLETVLKVTIARDDFGPGLYPQVVEMLQSHGTLMVGHKEHTGQQGASEEKLASNLELTADESLQKENLSGYLGEGRALSLPVDVLTVSQRVLGLPQSYIHYLAEAGAVKRVFPPERMLPILFKVADRVGIPIVLTGLKRQEIKDERCINLTGQTSLPEVLDIVANASVVVGNESGLTHLAWVLGKKTALFYGGGHWGRFRPTGDVLLLNAPCEYRCCDWKCRYGSIPVPCVNLADDEVLALLQAFV